LQKCEKFPEDGHHLQVAPFVHTPHLMRSLCDCQVSLSTELSQLTFINLINCAVCVQ
jgi:hypothetical protein